MSHIEAEHINEHGQACAEHSFMVSATQFGNYAQHISCSIFNDFKSYLKTTAHHFTMSVLKTNEHNLIIRTNFSLTGPCQYNDIDDTTPYLERIYAENISFFQNNIRLIELMEPETQHEFDLTLMELSKQSRNDEFKKTGPDVDIAMTT